MNCKICGQSLVGGYVLSSSKVLGATVSCPHCGNLNEKMDLSLFKVRRNVIKSLKKADGSLSKGKILAGASVGLGIIAAGVGMGFAFSKSGETPSSVLFGKSGPRQRRELVLPVVDHNLQIPETGLLEELGSNAKKINGGIPFDVSAHLRHLPDGRKASAVQKVIAEGKGIVIPEGMTYVKDFTKNK